jgi:hypothetical protein
MSNKKISDVLELPQEKRLDEVSEIAGKALERAKVSCRGLSEQEQLSAVVDASIVLRRAIMRYQGEVATGEPASNTNLTNLAVQTVRESCKTTKASQAK